MINYDMKAISEGVITIVHSLIYRQQNGRNTSFGDAHTFYKIIFKKYQGHFILFLEQFSAKNCHIAKYTTTKKGMQLKACAAKGMRMPYIISELRTLQDR